MKFVEIGDPYRVAEAAAARLAVLDAMSAALDRRDELFSLIGAAKDGAHALRALQSAFGFDEAQAHAVLDLQVRRFSARERSRIAGERESLRRSLDDSSTDL